jgi:photosystem II stability/assembly factor-like uncharacterized protein
MCRRLFLNYNFDSYSCVYTLGTDTVFLVGTKGMVARSENKSKDWIKNYYGSQTLNDIVFVTHKIGFVAGNNGTILKTTDSGTSWVNVNTNTTQNLNAIDATDLSNIWAVGDSGTVIRSQDEGQSWHIIPITSELPIFTDIKFKYGKGYIVGNLGSIYQTLDNGNTWIRQINIEGYTGQEYLNYLSITQNNVFLLLSREGLNKLCIFNGVNWQLKNIRNYEEVQGLYFSDDNTGYYTNSYVTTGSNSSAYLNIFKTSNQGDDWTLDGGGIGNEPVFGTYTSNFMFVDSLLGYFVSGEYLYRTPYVGDLYLGVDNIKNDTKIIKRDNSLLISNAQNEISSVRIISVSGRVLLQQNVNNQNETLINTSNFSKGIYIIQVNLKDNTQLSSKWIKQ